MNPIEFANYQRTLNAQRVNKLNSTPKLSPKVLISNEDFDVILENIPINITPPSLEMKKEQSNTETNLKENPLF